MPLFFFPCRDQRERANRERGKKRLASGFLLFGGILIYPTRRTRRKGAFFKRETATATSESNATRATGQKKRHRSARNATPHRQHHPRAKRHENARKKGERGNSPTERHHGSRAGATTGAPSTETSQPRQPHRKPFRQPRLREKTVASVVGGFCRQIKKTAVSRQRSWRLKILWRV